MTNKEAAKKYMAHESIIIKIMYRLWIIQLKVRDNQIGNKYVSKRMNPYNPLSYVALFLTIAIYGIVEIVSGIPAIKDEFKYH